MATPHRSRLAGVLAASLMYGSADAVALRPSKATDPSVCDLGHNTNQYLGGQMLVPAVASQKDQVDAFFRMAAGFVARECKNGQVLILQGNSELSVDGRSLMQVANSSCAAADVKRSEISVPRGDRVAPGFELRCTILKHSELVEQLGVIERSDPMDALRSRLAGAARQSDSGSSATTEMTPASKLDCNKLSLSSLLQGGRCKY